MNPGRLLHLHCLKRDRKAPRRTASPLLGWSLPLGTFVSGFTHVLPHSDSSLCNRVGMRLFSARACFSADIPERLLWEHGSRRSQPFREVHGTGLNQSFKHTLDEDTCFEQDNPLHHSCTWDAASPYYDFLHRGPLKGPCPPHRSQPGAFP